MKRILAAVLAALTVLMLAACGSSAAKTVDVQALADALKAGCQFDGNLVAVDKDQMGFMLMDMPECDAAMYISDGTTKEVIVAAQCKDSSGAAAMKKSLETLLAEQKDEAGKYQPEELQRLEGAVLTTAGNCVVLCVTSDTANANAIIKEYTK